MEDQKQLQRLRRKSLKQQYKARPRVFRQARTKESSWRGQFAYWLFQSFPAYHQRESKDDDRPEVYRRKDWRWELRYMKGRRLGYEIDLD